MKNIKYLITVGLTILACLRYSLPVNAEDNLTQQVLLDNELNIEVTGQIPSGATLEVEELKEQDVTDDLVTCEEYNEESEFIASYDITIDNNTANGYQPEDDNNELQVVIYNDAFKEYDNIEVYHTHNDITEKITSFFYKESGMIMFYTTSFSSITTTGSNSTSGTDWLESLLDKGAVVLPDGPTFNEFIKSNGYDDVKDIYYDETTSTSKYETYCQGYDGNGKVYFRKEDNVLYIHCVNTTESAATTVYFAPDSSNMFKDMSNLKYLTFIDDKGILGRYISNINSFCENTSITFDYNVLLGTLDDSVTSVTADRAFYCTSPSIVNIASWDMTKFSSAEDMFGPGVYDITLGKMKADTSLINSMFQSATGIEYLDPGYLTSGKVYAQQPNKLCKYSKSSTYDIDSHDFTYRVESPSQTFDITAVRQHYKLVDFAYLHSGDVFNYTIKSLVNETSDSWDDDNTITDIKLVTGSDDTTGVLVGLTDYVNIYAKLNGTVVELHTTADKVQLNNDTDYMFQNFKALSDVSMLRDEHLISENFTGGVDMFYGNDSLNLLDLTGLDWSDVYVEDTIITPHDGMQIKVKWNPVYYLDTPYEGYIGGNFMILKSSADLEDTSSDTYYNCEQYWKSTLPISTNVETFICHNANDYNQSVSYNYGGVKYTVNRYEKQDDFSYKLVWEYYDKSTITGTSKSTNESLTKVYTQQKLIKNVNTKDVIVLDSSNTIDQVYEPTSLFSDDNLTNRDAWVIYRYAIDAVTIKFYDGARGTTRCNNASGSTITDFTNLTDIYIGKNTLDFSLSLGDVPKLVTIHNDFNTQINVGYQSKGRLLTDITKINNIGYDGASSQKYPIDNPTFPYLKSIGYYGLGKASSTGIFTFSKCSNVSKYGLRNNHNATAYVFNGSDIELELGNKALSDNEKATSFTFNTKSIELSNNVFYVSEEYIDAEIGYLPTSLYSTLSNAVNYDWYSDGRAPYTVNFYSAKVNLTYDEYVDLFEKSAELYNKYLSSGDQNDYTEYYTEYNNAVSVAVSHTIENELLKSEEYTLYKNPLPIGANPADFCIAADKYGYTTVEAYNMLNNTNDITSSLAYAAVAKSLPYQNNEYTPIHLYGNELAYIQFRDPNFKYTLCDGPEFNTRVLSTIPNSNVPAIDISKDELYYGDLDSVAGTITITYSNDIPSTMPDSWVHIGKTDDDKIYAYCNVTEASPKNIYEIVIASDLPIKSSSDCSYMFARLSASTSLDVISNIDFSDAVQCAHMFDGDGISEVDVSGITSELQTIKYMFNNCSNLTSITGFEKLNVSNVSDFSYMLYNCKSLSRIDIRDWSIQESPKLDYALAYLGNKYTKVDILGLYNRSFNNVSAAGLFENSWLYSQEIDISLWTMSNCDYMFMGTKTQVVHISNSQIELGTSMFAGSNIYRIHGCKGVTSFKPDPIDNETSVFYSTKARYLEFADGVNFTNECWMNYDFEADNVCADIAIWSIPAVIEVGQPVDIQVEKYVSDQANCITVLPNSIQLSNDNSDSIVAMITSDDVSYQAYTTNDDVFTLKNDSTYTNNHMSLDGTKYEANFKYTTDNNTISNTGSYSGNTNVLFGIKPFYDTSEFCRHDK